jgi:hypothetical protein
MTISGSLDAVIFFLGTATGALLTRLQWAAFKQRVSQELIEEIKRASCHEGRSEEGDDPSETTVRIGGDALSASPLAGDQVRQPVSSDAISDPTVRALVEQKQIEISRIRREVQTLWDVMPLLEDSPDGKDESAQWDFSGDSSSVQIRYERWLNPRRAS